MIHHLPCIKLIRIIQQFYQNNIHLRIIFMFDQTVNKDIRD
jgi:hypothetical protein